MNKQWIFIIAPILLLAAVPIMAMQLQVIMDIEGMVCNLWPLAVKKSLSGIKGVEDVTVSYKEKKAWLTVDDTVTDADLVDAVQKAGPFKGKVIKKTPAVK